MPHPCGNAEQHTVPTRPLPIIPPPTPPQEPDAPVVAPLITPVVYVQEKQVWEYKVVQRKAGEPGPVDEAELNTWGADGWELVGVIPHGTATVYIFKRRKPNN